MDDEVLQAVVDRKVPPVPTFTFLPTWRTLRRNWLRAEPTGGFSRRNHRKRQDSGCLDAGVPLATGSESGFSLTPYGDWHYRELQVFVEDLGMTPLQAINSATEQGARALKLEGIGLHQTRLSCRYADF